MYMNGKHWNINADHVVLIEQRDWSVSYAYVTILYTRTRRILYAIHSATGPDTTE
jgi:hypothetical protein